MFLTVSTWTGINRLPLFPLLPVTFNARGESTAMFVPQNKQVNNCGI